MVGGGANLRYKWLAQEVPYHGNDSEMLLVLVSQPVSVKAPSGLSTDLITVSVISDVYQALSPHTRTKSLMTQKQSGPLLSTRRGNQRTLPTGRVLASLQDSLENCSLLCTRVWAHTRIQPHPNHKRTAPRPDFVPCRPSISPNLSHLEPKTQHSQHHKPFAI